MIRIPDTNKKISQPNNSDLFGNLWYTKNINLDEEGYIKLSSRSVSIMSEGDDTDFDIPTSFGRQGTTYYVATVDQPFEASIDGTTISVSQDVDNDGAASPPNLTSHSFGKWFNNKWNVTESDELYYKTASNGNWTNASVSLTAGVKHPMDVFRTRKTLCIGNGNVVKQVTEAYAANIDLTLPVDYEVVHLSYNSNKLGIITKIASSVSGQNQDAFFFVWDGKDTTPNASYATGSDFIYAIAPYKSSWAILTRTGQWKFFNGGGFEDLAALPSYYSNFVQGDSVNNKLMGDATAVEGDVVYINMPSQSDSFGRKGETQLQNFPAGVWCFDSKIGLYHRYSPSISKGSIVTVATSGVNTTSDVLTKNSGTLPATGNPIKYVATQSDLIGGLKTGTVYYIIKASASTFQLATTKANALAGTAINLTAQASGTSTFLVIDLVDYGTTRTARSGGIALTGTENLVSDHIIFGGEYYRTDATSDYARICLTVPGFSNRGFFVTPKLNSQNVEDNTQKIFIKHRPLGPEDSIIVKFKDRDVYGLPTTTPQGSTHCSWISSRVLSTTADLSEVESFINDDGGECEVEIVSGAGGGQMAQVESIVLLNETYTITLVDDIDGASLGTYCDIIVDNWKEVGEVDASSDKGWVEFSINTASKWAKFKVELRGVETCVEEVQIISDTQIASA